MKVSLVNYKILGQSLNGTLPALLQGIFVFVIISYFLRSFDIDVLAGPYQKAIPCIMFSVWFIYSTYSEYQKILEEKVESANNKEDS